MSKNEYPSTNNISKQPFIWLTICIHFLTFHSQYSKLLAMRDCLWQRKYSQEKNCPKNRHFGDRMSDFWRPFSMLHSYICIWILIWKYNIKYHLCYKYNTHFVFHQIDCRYRKYDHNYSFKFQFAPLHFFLNSTIPWGSGIV